MVFEGFLAAGQREERREGGESRGDGGENETERSWRVERGRVQRCVSLCNINLLILVGLISNLWANILF